MVTLILTLTICALLFFMIWSATYFHPWTGLLCALGFVGVIAYGGWDGVKKDFTFGQFFVRFLVMLFGMKAFDIIALDYFLITKTQFFQHYIPETKGCAGYHSFGYNRKEQFWRIVTLPFAALLTAWVCTLF